MKTLKVINIALGCMVCLPLFADNQTAVIFLSNNNHSYKVGTISCEDKVSVQLSTDSWVELNNYDIKNYIKLSSNKNYGSFLIDKKFSTLVFSSKKTKTKLNNKVIANYLKTQPWGKNYVDSSNRLTDMALVSASDINKNGLNEYWLSYKTMYGQFGGIVIEADKENVNGFKVISSDCPDCGE